MFNHFKPTPRGGRTVASPKSARTQNVYIKYGYFMAPVGNCTTKPTATNEQVTPQPETVPTPKATKSVATIAVIKPKPVKRVGKIPVQPRVLRATAPSQIVVAGIAGTQFYVPFTGKLLPLSGMDRVRCRGAP